MAWLGAACACALCVALAALVAPQLALSPRLAFAIAFAAVTLEILALSLLAPVLSSGRAVLSGLLCAVALVPLDGVRASPGSAALVTLALGSGATVLGAALGARVERPGQLVAVALVSGIADLWSAFDPGGPSARLAERALSHPEQLAVFALPFPLLGTELVPAIIGAGDVLFAALYVAAFRVHDLPRARVLIALALGFGAGLSGLLLAERPLPLLPLVGAAVVACDARARTLSAREWRTVLLAGGALAAAIALRWSRG